MKTVVHAQLKDDFFRPGEPEEIAAVRGIIEEVRAGGDRALLRCTEKFDKVKVESLKVEESAIEKAWGGLDRDDRDALEAAAEAIRRFALRQMEGFADFEQELRPGVTCGQRIVPIERIGVYAPGGKYPLPSTVLMCAIPARVAGAREIILCSPPTHNASIHPAILAAAKICGVSEIYRAGGAQAVAAMAFGTETIRPVDKIVGPGSRVVTAAKRLVFPGVGIDFIAGPTEVLIIADETADPSLVAADLIAQAEHDENAEAVLVTHSDKLGSEVEKAIERQLENLSTAPIARTSLDRSGLIVMVDNVDQAVDVANRKAPEHLLLAVEKPDDYIGRLRNYGTLFIGQWSGVTLGDYTSGLNHTLPTSGCARYTGGLGVKDFLKVQTTLRVTPEGLRSIGPAAKILGGLEGLEAHARSIDMRLRKLGA
ncbi:MAG: histidinol dehydrogenase [Pseudomonadota bacterium]